MKPTSPRPAGRRWAARLLSLVAILSLVALGTESALRFAALTERLQGPSNPLFPWVGYDPVVGRINRPGYVDEKRGIHIDTLGLRGDEITLAKPPGGVRIACLGDSTTFGIFRAGPFEIRATAAYAETLVEQLRAAGAHHVQVLNAGILGATSASALAVHLVTLRRLAVDVLVVRVGNNDHALVRGEPQPLATDLEYAVLQILPPWALRTETVRIGFHLYRRWLTTQAWATSGQQVPLARYERNLRRLTTVARDAGIRVLFLDFPYRPIERGPSPGESFPTLFHPVADLAELHALHDRYQAATERIARETGSAHLRTVDVLHGSPQEVFTDFDLSHPNEVGARLLGQLVFEELQRLGWLDPR